MYYKECDKCHTELEPSAKFCSTCGEKASLEITENMESGKPVPKVKVWIFKGISSFIALIVFMLAKPILIAINGWTADGKTAMGGMLLVWGVYAFLNGIFLKNKGSKKRGGLILLIVVASIAFSYFFKNSSYEIDEQSSQTNTNSAAEITGKDITDTYAGKLKISLDQIDANELLQDWNDPKNADHRVQLLYKNGKKFLILGYGDDSYFTAEQVEKLESLGFTEYDVNVIWGDDIKGGRVTLLQISNDIGYDNTLRAASLLKSKIYPVTDSLNDSVSARGFVKYLETLRQF